MPTIGFLSSLASSDFNLVAPAFLEGLNKTGFVDGRNITIEYRWAEGDYQRLTTLSADLVRRHVAVIAAISGTPAALGGDDDNPSCIRYWWRPRSRVGYQSQPPGRQHHGREFLHVPGGD
jgi:hypothetical protein